MKIIVAGFPESAITICLIEDDNLDDAVEREQVWHDDFIPTISSMIDENNVEEVYFFGPAAYTQGLAEQVKEEYKNTDNLNLYIME